MCTTCTVVFAEATLEKGHQGAPCCIRRGNQRVGTVKVQLNPHPRYLAYAWNAAAASVPLALPPVAQIVMEVRKTAKKGSGAVREALETVRQSVMDECGLFASVVVSMTYEAWL